MDVHLQDLSGNVPLWESEAVLPLTLPAGSIGYRTVQIPFIYVVPPSGITLYLGAFESDSLTEVTYEVLWIRLA